MTKSQTKTIIVCVGIMLVLLVGFGVLSSMTAGFTDFEPKEPTLNSDNLYTADGVTLVSTNDGNGVAITVDDNGAIELDGTADTTLKYTVGTVTLDAGTYTLSAYNKASRAGVYLTATDGENTYDFDFTPANTIEIEEDGTELTIELIIAKGTSLNRVDILPVIMPGEETGDFYE